MPVDFLSAAQIAGHGRYGEPPSARQLERFFHFDDRDRELIADGRGDHNRLGFPVQLATVRFLGTFLAHPADVPPGVAKTVARELVPLQLVSGQWKRLVLANPQLADGELDRRAYSFCVLEALQRALDRRDVFVTRSGRYSDPRAKLLSGPASEAARPEICASLNHHPNPAHALDRLCAELDGAYRQTAGRLDTNVSLEIQRIAGMDRPDLSALERLDEPAELSELRADVDALLPNRVAFSEILLEVCRWTAFADAFIHLSEGRARVKDRHISICAVLLAEACNISLHDVAHPGVPALTYARLSWVSQNYVRAETIAAANDLLLKVHAQIPLVAALGDGHIATVDGMRFRVPVRSIHAGPNPRYFDTGRGVTTPRRTARPALLALHPRQRLRRAARPRAQPHQPPLILAHWDDISRVLASLSTGTVRASDLLRVRQGGGRPTPLGRAIAELGRAATTLHLLHYIDSDTYRRCIGVHINRHEGRHAVARVIFHRNRGELRQPYREGQEDQLPALGFALNVLVLWNDAWTTRSATSAAVAARSATSISRDSRRCSTSAS